MVLTSIKNRLNQSATIQGLSFLLLIVLDVGLFISGCHLKLDSDFYHLNQFAGFGYLGTRIVLLSFTHLLSCLRYVF